MVFVHENLHWGPDQEGKPLPISAYLAPEEARPGSSSMVQDTARTPAAGRAHEFCAAGQCVLACGIRQQRTQSESAAPRGRAPQPHRSPQCTPPAAPSRGAPPPYAGVWRISFKPLPAWTTALTSKHGRVRCCTDAPLRLSMHAWEEASKQESKALLPKF